jgi:hypothetical protein
VGKLMAVVEYSARAAAQTPKEATDGNYLYDTTPCGADPKAELQMERIETANGVLGSMGLTEEEAAGAASRIQAIRRGKVAWKERMGSTFPPPPLSLPSARRHPPPPRWLMWPAPACGGHHDTGGTTRQNLAEAPRTRHGAGGGPMRRRARMNRGGRERLHRDGGKRNHSATGGATRGVA